MVYAQVGMGVYTFMLMEASSWSQVSSSIALHLTVEAESLTELETHRFLLDWLSKKIQESSYLQPPTSSSESQPQTCTYAGDLNSDTHADTTGTSLPEQFSCLQASPCTSWLSKAFITIAETWLRHLSRTWTVSKPIPHVPNLGPSSCTVSFPSCGWKQVMLETGNNTGRTAHI